MSLKDVARNPLDLSSALAGGTPADATDATHVDNAAPPGAATDVADATAQGTSLLAARADHEHLGVRSIAAADGSIVVAGTAPDFTIAATASTNKNQIALSDMVEHTVLQSDNEKIVSQFNADADVLAGAILTNQCSPFFSALLAKSVNGLTATAKLYAGGTIDTLDGSLIATLIYNAAATAWVMRKNAGAAFDLKTLDSANGVLVKVTLRATDGAAGDSCQIRGMTAVLSG